MIIEPLQPIGEIIATMLLLGLHQKRQALGRHRNRASNGRAIIFDICTVRFPELFSLLLQ
ncbi:MAG: hypothetical protein KME45_16265 [Stenomitos rutilans HA7619-LM2]|jgi:hypothetical protein|nr:hypothetical protein [Stenomitos rutilans HA7619-LM2]